MGKSDGKTDDEIWYTVLKLSSGNDCYIANWKTATAMGGKSVVNI